MNKMYVGKYINTHGIKGEIKILSDIDHKDLIFKIGNTLLINNKEFIIKTYRIHKNIDMVSFENINNINDILDLKGKNVFIDRDTLDKDILFYNDLIGKNIIINDNVRGHVDDYDNGLNPLLICTIDKRIVYVPIKSDFIKKIDENVVLDEKVKELMI